MPSSAETLAILGAPVAVEAPAPPPMSDSLSAKMGILDQAIAGKLPEKPASPSMMDKLIGRGTERYQTWPERVGRGLFEAAQSAVALPRDVMEAAATPRTEISDTDTGPLNTQRLTNMAAFATGLTRQPGGQVVPTARGPGGSAVEAAPILSEGQQVAEAGRRIGVDLPRAVTSDSMSTQWAGKIATNAPFAGTPLRQASERAIEQLGEAATRTQGALGTGNVPTSGAAIREGLTGYIKGHVADRKEALYSKVGEFVDPVKARPLTETAGAAQTILNRRGAANITQPSEAVKRIEEAVTNPNGLTYEGTKTLRSYIGEMLDGRSPLPADMSQSELKQIYGSLSRDLRSVAEFAGGEKALRAFERANNYSRLASDRSEKLAGIIGANSDEAIFDRLTAMAGTSSRANLETLRAARRSMDATSWDEYASGVISRLGRDAEGNFSPDRFVTGFGKLTPEAKSILFKSTGKADVAKALDDIATVSSRMKSLNKFANPSGTGQTVAGVAELHGLMYDPLTTLGSIVSGRVLAHVLAKPETVKPVARWSKAMEKAAERETTETRQAYNQASRALAAAIGREVGRPDLAQTLFGRLTGAVPSAANPEQQNR